MSPLTYRDIHRETKPYYPTRHHHWVLPTFHQVVPRALQMPGLLIIVLLGHQAGGHCPTHSSAHPKAKLHTTGGRQTEMPGHSNIPLLCTLHIQLTLNFSFFNIDRSYLYKESRCSDTTFPVMFVICAHNSDAYRTLNQAYTYDSMSKKP